MILIRCCDCGMISAAEPEKCYCSCRCFEKINVEDL